MACLQHNGHSLQTCISKLLQVALSQLCLCLMGSSLYDSSPCGPELGQHAMLCYMCRATCSAHIMQPWAAPDQPYINIDYCLSLHAIGMHQQYAIWARILLFATTGSLSAPLHRRVDGTAWPCSSPNFSRISTSWEPFQQAIHIVFQISKLKSGPGLPASDLQVSTECQGHIQATARGNIRYK